MYAVNSHSQSIFTDGFAVSIRLLICLFAGLLILLTGVSSTLAQQRNFKTSDRMVMTYLFCWYDIATYEQIVTRQSTDYLSVHPSPQTTWYDAAQPDFSKRKPPEMRGGPDFSYKNPYWFAQQLQWMKDAGIDAVAVDYMPVDPFLARSNLGAENLNLALSAVPSPPAVCLFLESAPFLRNTNLHTSAGVDRFFRGIQSFYSRIDRRHWLLINNQVPVILYKSDVEGLVISDAGLDRVRRNFKAWSGRELCFFGNESWQSKAPNSVRYDCAWGAANRRDRIISGKDLMSVSPGMSYKGRSGNAPRSSDGYRSAWEAARRTGKNWVAIETWSEFIEGSAIAPTVEEGSALLEITLNQAKRFKARR